jgi:UDP-N-acetylglucosamine 2-epimerase (non-hydrolysing)
VEDSPYILMTMHRPATVDHAEGLNKLLSILTELDKKYKIVFPIHPRTRQNLKKYQLHEAFENLNNLIFTDPIDYLSFQKLILHARFILTDSGGIQEETTFRHVPCLTLRPNTERPSTVELGTNELIPFDTDNILNKVSEIEKGNFKKNSQTPPLWDGKATERIVKILAEKL